MRIGESQPKFRRNITPPSSGSKSKPCKKLAEESNKQKTEFEVTAMRTSNLSADLLVTPDEQTRLYLYVSRLFGVYVFILTRFSLRKGTILNRDMFVKNENIFSLEY
jgi:hypothetical protein